MTDQIFIDLLKREVVPALGCTEPIAVAYAVARGREILGEVPENIELLLSANIIKNALGVGIPGTGMIGTDIAATLGAIGGNAKACLEVLKDVNEYHVQEAKKMVESGCVKTKLKHIDDKLYIEAVCKKGDSYSKVIIKGNHSNIVCEELNGQVLLCKEGNCGKNDKCESQESQITVDSIYNFAITAPFEKIEFLLEGAKMNKKVSDEGLKGEYGLQVGKKMSESEIKLFTDNLSNKIIAATAAASDARMSGCSLPIMTTAGSGNQGITTTLPSVILAESLGKSEEELARALAISNLITIHMKSYIGRLSPLCGAGIAGATGTCCAITYLLGGELSHIKCAIKNMIADVSGMICDGAKTTCALKIATSVNAAMQCATLALNGIKPAYTDGIIHDDVEQTIKNLANLGLKGMESTDNIILDMMLSK